jgi:hypothetical protein
VRKRTGNGTQTILQKSKIIMNHKHHITDCTKYIEDFAVCDDIGEPKGQCINCGYKWYEHNLTGDGENDGFCCIGETKNNMEEEWKPDYNIR